MVITQAVITRQHSVLLAYILNSGHHSDLSKVSTSFTILREYSGKISKYQRNVVNQLLALQKYEASFQFILCHKEIYTRNLVSSHPVCTCAGLHQEGVLEYSIYWTGNNARVFISPISSISANTRYHLLFPNRITPHQPMESRPRRDKAVSRLAAFLNLNQTPSSRAVFLSPYYLSHSSWSFSLAV